MRAEISPPTKRQTESGLLASSGPQESYPAAVGFGHQWLPKSAQSISVRDTHAFLDSAINPPLWHTFAGM